MKLSIVAALSFALSGCVVAIGDDRPEFSYTESEDIKRVFVEDAKIINLSSSTNGWSYDFYVEIEGGTGECAGKKIGFTRIGHVKMGERLFDLAKIAYLEKKTVTIGNNGGGNGCNDASFIVTTG